MSVDRSKLEFFFKELLQPERFKDYCPNDIIVEGKETIDKVIFGVSLTMELIEIAVEKGADAIVVHHPHGFWDKQLKTIKGATKNKISTLLKHDISVFGFHLPLDAHYVIGNNASIVKMLGMEMKESFYKDYGVDLGYVGEFSTPIPYKDFITLVEQKIGPVVHDFAYGKTEIVRVAVCSGGAPNGIFEAMECADVYLTGEAREQTQAIAKEEKFNYIAAGHHQTEVFGVRELSLLVNEKFGIETEFINLPNPV